MALDWLNRTELLIGKDKVEKLQKSHVFIAGLGGVGAYAAENICRAGIGSITIADNDVVSVSNKNRQLPALTSTINQSKAEVIAKRLKDINPELKLNVYNTYLKDQVMIDILNAHKYDYLVDAIDTLSPKLYLLYHSYNLKIPTVSSMGSGGRLNPTLITIADISHSYNCRLAYYIRKKLHVLGIKSGIDVVFSPEPVDRSSIITIDEQNKKSIAGTISYMTAVFGSYCAYNAIQHLLKT